MCLQRKLSILLKGMQPGEGTTELHQAAAFAQSANVDGGEAELLDQRGDTGLASESSPARNTICRPAGWRGFAAM